jgi:malonyl-CoA/methylmalonyl-CoA synthetase
VFGGFSAEALRSRIDDCQARVVITADGGFRKGGPSPLKPAVDQAIADGADVDTVLVVKRTGDEVAWVDGRDVWWHDTVEKASKTHEAEFFDSEHPLYVMYTSGTTGKPKAAMLTRGNLASNAATLVALWRFTRSDVLLPALPIFHIHGLFVATNTVLASAASMLFLPKFEIEEVLRQMPRASVMMGVPTYYTRLLNDSRLSREATAHMRLFVSGSAPLSAGHHREFEQRTGHAILERYGMTETSMICSNRFERRVPGAVGAPLPGVEVRISDPQSGAVSGEPDAAGMIEVRGPNVFQGYWRNPHKTAAEFRSDGFFVTGDIGRVDAAGYVSIVGRAKDLIITGGYNVYPAEVEQELNALPGVLESAVFGVPHPDFGEGVTALIVCAAGGRQIDEATILRELRDRLAGYKLPKRVLFAAELPRNTMGKLQKQTLRDTHAKLYTA